MLDLARIVLHSGTVIIPNMKPSPLKSIKVLLATILLAASCQSTPTTTLDIAPSPTQTVITLPTETAIPLAALVNEEPITVEEYESELARYQDSRGTDLATDNESSAIVIRALIERHLLMQGAHSFGLNLEENEPVLKLEQLIAELGGQESYLHWLEQNHYTTASFEQALMDDMLATKMVEKILSNVPQSELQANARHILVASQEEAERLRQEILAGADFAELAVLYSMDLSTRPAGGDLGWFARGTLTMPSVEEAIFQLEPGELSDVIASELGYHIVQLVQLEDRPLSYDTWIRRQEQAIERWLEEKWEQAEIEIFLTP
jgi:parvulin-like peptidyl-prolyl isomerase